MELLGELPQWNAVHPFQEMEPGRYQLELDLEPGTYACKARIDGKQWHLLPDLPEDRTGPDANSTLAVGSTEPPLFFAPWRRAWCRGAGNTLLVHCELSIRERTQQEPTRTDSSERAPPIQALGTDGEPLAESNPWWTQRVGNRIQLRYRLSLPENARSVRFRGDLSRFALPGERTEEPPAWLKSGFIYSILVDRWHRGAPEPDPRSRWRDLGSTKNTIFGGDLAGILGGLNYIKGLGATAVALTPLYPSQSPHRYDARDFGVVDPRLGGEQGLRQLVAACHGAGLAILLDAAFTHCHREHHAFRDLLEHQRHSRYRGWFRLKQFPVSFDDSDSYEHYWQMPQLPLLDLGHDTLQAHLLDVVDGWLELGIDGLRLDAVEMAPDRFWSRLYRHVRARSPGVVLIAESVVQPAARYVEQRMATAVLDFQVRDYLLNWFARHQDHYASFGIGLEAILHRRGPLTSPQRVLFLDNHDMNRFVTEATFHWRARLALTFLLLRPEPVWFYYGTEMGLTSGRRSLDAEGAWPDRLPMPPLDTRTKTLELVRQLGALRRQWANEGYDEGLMVDGTGDLIVYRRSRPGGQVSVVLNFTDRTLALPARTKGTKQLLSVVDDSDAPEGSIAPHGGLVLQHGGSNQQR